MSQARPTVLFIKRLVILGLFTALIFATLPIFPAIWNMLSISWPRLLNAVTQWYLAALALCLFAAFLFQTQRHSLLFYFGLAVIFSAFGLLLVYACEFPAERLHLAEYGLLVYVTYRTLCLKIRPPLLYVIVFLYACMVGTADELIQGLLPNRHYETKDMFINWATSGLTTLLIAGLYWKNHVRPRAVRLVRFAAWCVLIVMAALQAAMIYSHYERPLHNVIILTVDTLRTDHLSISGYRRDTTPYLKSIAPGASIFNNVISSAPWTCPSLISLFTGQYPSLHGVQARGRSILPTTVTLFDIFRQNGYRVPDIAYLTDIPNFAHLGLDPKNHNDPATRDQQPGAELMTWLRANRHEKFCLWYHYRFLHLPYNPHATSLAFLSGITEAINSANVTAVRHEAIIPRGSRWFTPPERRVITALYDCQLREFDAFLESLCNLMSETGLDGNTLLVITADHGEELFEHGFIGHASTALSATMYDEVLKIPLILFAPGFVDRPRILSQQVRQIDIMPTILDIMHLPIPPAVQGESLLPVIKGHADPKPLPALSESVIGGYQTPPDREHIVLRSLRTSEWKLISTSDGSSSTYRLFNLLNDPAEINNIISANGRIADTLKLQLASAFADMRRRRLALLSSDMRSPITIQVPNGQQPARPTFITPGPEETINMASSPQVILRWTGDSHRMYMLEYEVGQGVKQLRGRMCVQGSNKIFGPLPQEAWEPLPYWNPYRIRVAPYGREDLWSDWLTFYITAQ